MSATQAPESIQDAIVNIGYFTHEISCLGVINLGDNTDGDTPQAETLQRNAYLNQLVFHIIPALVIMTTTVIIVC